MSPRRPPGVGKSPEGPPAKRAQQGDARVDMRQVADRAGVALSSVSRVLSGHRDVSDDMRQKVTAAARELGYEGPNMLAAMLRTGATRTIGFVIGDISNPLMAEIALGAEVTLREAGYTMMLVNSLSEAQRDASQIQLLQQRRVDGLLLSVTDETSEDTASALSRASIPAVLIDRDLPALPASAVLSDHATGITAAIEHLIGLGHRRIALIAGTPHVRPTRERIAAAEAAAEANPGVLCQVRPGAYTQKHGADTTAELMASRRAPTAIIAGGNQILVGVLSALRDKHLRIPRDLSLVTCDDVPLAEFLSPPLATIRRDPRQMGATAATLLLSRLGGAAPQAVTLPTTFAAADSCAEPPQPLHDTSLSRSNA